MKDDTEKEEWTEEELKQFDDSHWWEPPKKKLKKDKGFYGHMNPKKIHRVKIIGS